MASTNTTPFSHFNRHFCVPQSVATARRRRKRTCEARTSIFAQGQLGLRVYRCCSVSVEQLMDQSIPHEDIQNYRRALTESSGVELLQVLIILIQLLEEEKKEPSPYDCTRQPNTLM